MKEVNTHDLLWVPRLPVLRIFATASSLLLSALAEELEAWTAPTFMPDFGT